MTNTIISCRECQQKQAARPLGSRQCRFARSRRRTHHRESAIPVPAIPSCRVQSSHSMFVRNSSIYLLGLLTCAAVIVQAFATTDAPSGPLSPWGTRGGAHVGVASKAKRGLPSPSSALGLSISDGEEGHGEVNGSGRKERSAVDGKAAIPSPSILVNGLADNRNPAAAGTGSAAPGAPRNGRTMAPPSFPTLGKAKKTIMTPGGFTDEIVQASYVAETNLPTDVGHFRIRAYRMEGPEAPHPLGAGAGLGTEPCLIYCTAKPPFGAEGTGGLREVPVRIHDQCFTSEVFRSQRCDCKEQLTMSLEYIRENGGALIYLQQEGRGIGLANKVAAYALQDIGLDTVDANTHLGFPEDARQYGVVPSLLADMGIASIRLMSNNPRKIERLTALGVEITGTIPMVVPDVNPYNKKYLETKQARMRHQNFGSMLSSSGVNSILAGDYSHVDIMLDEASAAVGLAADGAAAAAAAAATAVTAATATTATTATTAPTVAAQRDVDPDLSGVTAAADGYCFGRRSVEDAIAAVARGELIVVVDDESRENEGDFIMAADKCTPAAMAEFIRYSSGVICIGMEGRRMDELALPAMVTNNEDPKGTAFSVSVDATSEHGITTGISATDRARTSVLLADMDAGPGDFHRPGHIFPLRAQENGVLARDGHTEAAIDFARLAGSSPAGLLCEIVSEENPVEMARLPELTRFCERHGYVLTSIADLQQYRRDTGL